MTPQERHLQDRLGSALFRLAAIEQKTTEAESPRATARLLAEVRKLTADLQRSLTDVQELIRRNTTAQQSAAVAIARSELLFEITPVASVLLEPIGVVVDTNAAAARLLNVSPRHLVGKSFPLFLAADRGAFVQRLSALSESDEPLRWKGTVRPRERSAVPCTLLAVRDPEDRILVMIVPGDLPDAPAKDVRLAAEEDGAAEPIVEQG